MHRRASGFTLIELLVTLSVIGILIALLLPAVQMSRESARRVRCRSRLRQLAVALHNYHDVHGTLPPGSISVGPAFTPFSGWGWGAMLLPYVDQTPLYEQVDFDVHTAGGANRHTIESVIPFWFCPTDPSPSKISVPAPSGQTLFVAAGNFSGLHAMLSPLSHVRFREVTDGLSNTFLLGETVYRKNRSGVESTASWVGIITFPQRAIGNSIPHAELSPNAGTNGGHFSSHHPGGVQYALGDGQAIFISHHLDKDVYFALGTPSGGEPVEF